MTNYHPNKLKEEKLLDELADILFDQWLMEVNQTSYNAEDENAE